MQQPIDLNLAESDSDDFTSFQRRAGAPRIARRQLPLEGYLHEDSQSDTELNVNLSPELLRINTFHNLTALANIRSARLINSDFNPGNETIGRSKFGAESGLHSDQDIPQEPGQGNRAENPQEDYGFRRAVEEFDELFTSYNQARSTHAGEIFPSFLSEIPRPISRPTPQLQEFRPTLPLE